MKKSISIETMFREVPFYQRFAKVKEAGFDYVEFGVWANLDITRVMNLIKEHGLKVAAISGDRDYSPIVPDAREDFLEYLSQSLAVAKTFNCKHLVIHSNPIGESGAMSLAGAANSDFTKVAAATRALMDAAQKAERAGRVLLLKPVSTYKYPGSFMHNTATAGAVVRVVNSPHLKLLYDVSQMQLMEGNILNTLAAYRDCIGYVHLSGSLEYDGLREVNIPSFKKMLVEELGYDGIVGFELQSEGNNEACINAIRDF